MPYAGVLDEALDGAKGFHQTGYDALYAGESETTEAITEDYFGMLAGPKREGIRGQSRIKRWALGLVCTAVFAKMMRFVENEEDMDVVIRVSTRHLSDDIRTG